MAGKKRRRTSEDGSDRHGEVRKVGDHRHLVVKLKLEGNGRWVCTRSGSDGGDTLGLDRRLFSPSTELMEGELSSVDDGVNAMLGQQKRLVLVLDLDHTLLHSTRIRHLSPQETHLLRQEPPHPVPIGQPTSTIATGGGEGGGGGGRSHRPLLFNLESTLGFITKLRPFVHTFLREASSMYDLCICTMGDRAYAREMARILDPDSVYFSPDDIISRSDFTEKDQKGLDVVRRGDDRTTIILDDTVAVWEKHLDNLVPVPAYHYFSHSRQKHGCTGKSLAELREDEDESTGALTAALDLLRRAHRMFFDRSTSSGSDPSSRDVRDILRSLRDKPELPVLQQKRIVVRIKVR